MSRELNKPAMTELRSKLREADVEYQVIKNTMLRRAVEGTDVEVIQGDFKGPSAIALSVEDPVAPAKILTDFAKTNPKLEIRVGVLEGKVLDLASIKALSDLPSREELLAQVLAAMDEAIGYSRRITRGIEVNEDTLAVLKKAGIAQVTITSSARTAQDQARIMYENITRHGVAHQKRLYGSYGDKVIDEYASLHAAGKSQQGVPEQMREIELGAVDKDRQRQARCCS